MPSTNHAPRILVVDDDEGMLILMAEALRAEGYEVATAGSGREARECLGRHAPDLMLLDLKLPDASGPALVAELQREKTLVPFVVVTGQGDEKAAVEVMKQGALDYVMKDSGMLDLLPAVAKRALAVVAQGRALAAAEAKHRRLEREILAVGERERHSIGADLHDGLGQQLTAIELMCAALKEDAAPYPALAQRLAVVGKMLREAIVQTRFLARGLVPVGSDPGALAVGLAELAEHVNAIGRARCEFECPGPINIADPFVAGHLYRIAQEGVNNAVKHANARRIVVRLEQGGGRLLLEVSDDGAGLAKVRASRAGLGLGVMQHRADAIGARLTIASKRGNGVTIRCSLAL